MNQLETELLNGLERLSMQYAQEQKETKKLIAQLSQRVLELTNAEKDIGKLKYKKRRYKTTESSFKPRF